MAFPALSVAAPAPGTHELPERIKFRNHVINSGIDSGSIHLYCLMDSNWADAGTGKCWPSTKTLAEKLGCTPRTVITRIQMLVKAGFLHRIRRGLTKTNLYVLPWGSSFRNDSGLPLEVKPVSCQKVMALSHRTRYIEPEQNTHTIETAKGAVPVVEPVRDLSPARPELIPSTGIDDKERAGNNHNPRKPEPVFDQRLPKAASVLYANHPIRKGSQPEIEKALKKIVTTENIPVAEQHAFLRQLCERHARWCSSEDWDIEGHRYVKNLVDWLDPRQARYRDEPRSPKIPTHFI